MMGSDTVADIVDTILEEAHAKVVNETTYFFAGGVWYHGDRALDELIVGIDRSTTRAIRSEVRDQVGLLAHKGEFAPPRYIGFRNGVLDIKTMLLEMASPDRIVPNTIPWDWVSDASSDAVETYLDTTAAGDPTVRARIEEMLGACLYREALSVIFLILGIAPVEDGSAANGKSTLAELCHRMVGRENSIALDIHALGARFMAAQLAGVLVDVSPDTSPERPDRASLSVLKSVATGDRINSDVKNSRPIDFYPYATPIIVANRAPGFLVDSGLKRRPVVIPLRGKFPRGGTSPLGAIANDENMPALLLHAVAGLRRFLSKGATPCPAGDSVLAGVVALSSSVDLWLSEQDGFPMALNGESCASVYKKYVSWCCSQMEHQVRRSDFDLDLRERWPDLLIKRCRFNGESTTNRWLYPPANGSTNGPAGA